MFMLCAAIFFWLTNRMAEESRDTATQIGDFYIERMSAQITSHFQTTMDIKLAQVESIIKTTPPDGYLQGDALIESMAVSGAARDFKFLGLFAEDGSFEVILGDEVSIADADPFFASLKNGDEKIAAASSPNYEMGLVLLGVPCEYDMSDGGKSIALVAGVDLRFINTTLSLDGQSEETYSHIIRRNGDYVIKRESVVQDNCYQRLFDIVLETDEKGAQFYAENIQQAIDARALYTDVVSTMEGTKCVYVTPLPYSEWYLITAISYEMLDHMILKLDYHRLTSFLIAMALMFLVFIIVFAVFYKMTKRQLAEIEAAHKEAITANKAKSEFLSNMSHDIRTPMNAIVGMTAIAAANIDDKPQLMNCLKKITLSSRHLLGLINDVLDMSKIESGKMTLNPGLVSLRETMESIVSIIQPQIKAKNQQFDIFISNILAEDVYCDSVRLNQVLINLLSNAFKFTPEKGEIYVFLNQEESPKGDNFVRVHFRVKDNGIGMSPEFRKRIFESFAREDNTRVNKTEGTGLGMTISKYIVEAMEGTIEVESEPNKGTEFHVTLDLEKAAVKETDMVLPGWNMLLADDDEQLCRDTAAHLKDMTVNCDWVTDGKTAIDMVEKRYDRYDKYQLVLLDWKMKEMDGIETARELRKRFGNEVPILLISAYDWSDIEEEAREAGVSGFIPKPLFKSTLFHGLMQFMSSVPEKPEVKKTAGSDLNGVRILLAEDNDLNYEIAKELLSGIGIEVEWAENGQICVDMFRSAPEGYYDAVLMDIRMPVMSGYEATRQIRSLKRSDAKLPIIAMTADAFSEDVKKCKECGMNDHMSKPIDMEVLTHILSYHLQRNS